MIGGRGVASHRRPPPHRGSARPGTGRLARSLLVLAVGVAALAVTTASVGTAAEVTRADAPEHPELPGLLQPPASWPDPTLPELAAWILVDADTGQVLGEQAADVRRPVASTVKILTALTAVETLDLDDQVTVGDEVVDVEGAGVDLEVDETWTVEQLLDALLARSGNDAAEALAVAGAGDRERFIAAMEDTAAALGVEGLDLVSVSGLDDDNRLSARDLATLGRATLDDPELRDLVGRRTVVLPGVGEVETRNLLLERYGDATGIKTGFTLAAGNSLVASAARDGRELVAVVLGAGDDPARFEAATALLDHGFDAFAPAAAAVELDLAVAGGTWSLTSSEVELLAPVDAEVTVDVELPARTPTSPVAASLVVDDDPLGEVAAAPDGGSGPPPVEGDAAVGRALTDGAWVALRAAAVEGALG